MGLRECCREEAAASLDKHRDVATCDTCGNLLLAYGDQETFELTTRELGEQGASFDAGMVGSLHVVAKRR